MFIGIFPLIALTAATAIFKDRLPAWVFMWILAAAIFFGCKWLSFWALGPKRRLPSLGRTLCYLFAWPGMDAEDFLLAPRARQAVGAGRWSAGLAKTAFGFLLFAWGAERLAPHHDLLRGWLAMLGLVLLLHFGIFDLLASFWRSRGIPVQPLMDHPLRSASLSEFWGKRWNRGFRNLGHRFVFTPLKPYLGISGAGFAVFFASGLIHDLVISWPARGGYGLPTLYFLIQGLGVLGEKSRAGRRLGLESGWRGWVWMAILTAAPAYWLFHPDFIRAVILPMMEDLGRFFWNQ